MKLLLTVTALGLALAPPAFGFDSPTQAIIDRHKAGKLVSVTDIASLMRSSERWCYIEDAGSCAWSDIYLEVTDAGAEYEIGNAWDETFNIVFTDSGVFKDDRYICETGIDWLPTMRAAYRSDGTMVYGRDLDALRDEVGQADDVIDCFDYAYVSSDAEKQTIRLLQRQYTDDVYDPGKDTEVTLHFNADNAAALTWRW